MVYNGIELATMGELFNKALAIAKSGDSTECSNFLNSYAEYIYAQNSRDKVPTMEDAYKCAKSNLGYFSGYYDSETYELINKAYNDSEISGEEYERVVRYVESILTDEKK